MSLEHAVVFRSVTYGESGVGEAAGAEEDFGGGEVGGKQEESPAPIVIC